ncbi:MULTISPECIES: HIT family protein [Variovorax]|jgi:diadenosine tetraphosphate (Ap4A) HIT family hydrolase|nr:MULTISPECIES: HIT family protein [Variovorax]
MTTRISKATPDRMSNDCIFCKIIEGQSPSHTIWEDESHVAFLSIFPNTEGCSVVIPRKHSPSYAFHLEDDALAGLVLAARKVGLLLDRAFDDVGRTGMVLEGFGVDHVHAKLFPMHGTPKQGKWQPIKSNVDRYFTRYEGYLSSHDHARASDEALAMLAARIRAAA